MKRAIYLVAVVPLIFVASVAAAIGEAVFAFPEEWLGTPEPRPVAFPFPDEYEWLVDTSARSATDTKGTP